jgi:hypothetical protein
MDHPRPGAEHQRRALLRLAQVLHLVGVHRDPAAGGDFKPYELHLIAFLGIEPGGR